MRCAFCFFFVFTSLIYVAFYITWSEAKDELIIKVPHKKESIWRWSWNSQWVKKTNRDGKVFYQICEVSSSGEPNKWIRSNRFLVGDAKRIDVTVEYAVSKCSSVSLAFCKQYLRLAVHKNSTNSTRLTDIPEPQDKPEVYQIFGTTSPSNLTTGGLSRNFVNTETHSFLTNSSTLNHFFAIQYRGGCFNLYSVTISYSVCPSLVLPNGLIQLPRTIAPVSGTIEVTGLCTKNAQPLANNVTLYGHCMANGEWNNSKSSVECWCKAGYGKYLDGSGAICDDCPQGTFQDSPSGNPCKPCPLNSVQDVDRKSCDCASNYYRTGSQNISDNCTAQPSAPQDIRATFLNATVAVLQWMRPSSLGGRSDEYYGVECQKCDDEGKNCIVKCNGSEIIHSPKNSRKATIKHLAAYTYYQFKVFAKNGVTHLAEKNGEKPKYAVFVNRTSETFPGVPVLTIDVLSLTAVQLSWTLSERNGLIIYYQVNYYPVGEKSEKKVFNTSKNNIAIGGLTEKTNYFFQVRASTRVGFGQPGNITQTIAMRSINDDKGKQEISTEQIIGTTAGILVLIALLCIIVIVIIVRRRRKRKNNPRNDMIPLTSERFFIDPSNYGSPLEAMKSHTTEIESKNLLLKINIGEGEFADVYKGILLSPSKREVVAVKILKPSSSTKNKKDFILEASIMGQFKHPNVIELKGVVTSSPDYPMMIVTEFMDNGSLDHFLKSRDGLLTPLQQIGIARGVANGMAYLAGMNFIHRDLAARNILVAENMASKISDFGLSRELDTSENNPESIYLTQGSKMPIRWTPPEAIRFRKFSSASDVWSFGILFWEIMAFAERPYWDWENEKVFSRVEEGFRLPAPMNCPKSIHDIMLDCWRKDVNDRPKFPDIVKRLDEMIRSPDKMNRQLTALGSIEGHTNLGEVTSVEEWLIGINMRQYTDKFTEAGLNELYQVVLLDDGALKRVGISLIGHRNKIYKSICELRSHRNQKFQDVEITI